MKQMIVDNNPGDENLTKHISQKQFTHKDTYSETLKNILKQMEI